MSTMWRLSKGIFEVSAAAQRGMAHSMNQSMAQRAQRQSQRGSRAAQRGIIGPWDPPPPPHLGDYLDFSGVARPEDVTGNGADFPLGRYVLPRKKWEPREELGLTATAANSHTVVFGASTAGKTTSIIAPWIYAGMRAGYLVVAVDLKGNNDLIDKVAQYAAAQPSIPDARIGVFDYNAPATSMSWNWIADLQDETSVNAAAEALCGRDRENDPNREFRLRDLKWMRGLLELVNTTGAVWTVHDLLALLDDQERLQLLMKRQSGSRAAVRLGDLAHLDPADYSRSVQFLTTYLEVLNTNGFVRITRRSELSLHDLDDEPGLFVVSAPYADQKLGEAVSGLFLSQFLNRQLQKFNTNSRPVLLILDEAPRLKDRIDLPGLMSLAASANMSVVLAVQEVNNFRDDERDVIFANCGTWVLMGGAGPKTTEYFGSRLGTRIAVRQTQSSSFTREGRTWQSGHQTADVPVLGHVELSNPPGGSYGAIVHSRSLSRKPIITDLTRYDL
jgi:type IV secretory pathway TraG/TraD family ATPase VirD4